MEKKKKYLTIHELVMAAIQRASEDPIYQEVLKRCSLEYSMVPTAAEKYEIRLCNFDTIGHAEYGSDGNGPRTKEVFVAKTLSTSKDAYLGMAMLMALICFHLDEYAKENMNRFD